MFCKTTRRYALLTHELFKSNVVFNTNRPLQRIQNRTFSLQNTIESIAKTQTGIFKSISESTPVEYCQSFLVTVHDYSGLPWWATIVCSTVIARGFVTLPLAVYQSYILAKLENLRLEMPAIANELRKETAMAVKLYKWDEKQAKSTYNRSIRKQWQNLILRDNCHPFKASLLMLFQIPTWVCLSVSLRNLVYMLPMRDSNAEIIFAELTLGGFGFIPNLTAVDSSWILPVCVGVINLLIIELQRLSRLNEPNKLQKILTNVFRGLSVIMIPIGASVPSCLVLYWTTSSAFGLMQNILLMSPKVKRFCKIPKTQSEMDRPYKFVASKLFDSPPR